VVHLVERYLSYSETWIHRQIRWLPHDAVSLVAERLELPGPSAFPVRSMLVLAQAYPRAVRFAALLSPSGRAGAALAVPFIRRQRPHVLHAHFGYTAWRWAAVSRRLGVPLVASFYGRDLAAWLRRRPKWRSRYGRLFATGTRFLCEGPAMAAALADLGCPRDKIGIQRLGVDVAGIDAAPRRLRPGEPLEVLAAARFVEKKGLPDAIAAAALAARDVELRLTVAGGPVDSAASRAETARIEAAAAASGLGDRLRFVGVLTPADLTALAYRSHLFIQPSRTAADGDTEGGAPVALIDLAATGLPAVATLHADIPDVVSDGVGGLLSPEGDVKALAANVVRLGREPELLLRLSLGAAAHVRDAFTADRCAASLRAHYLAAAGEGRR